MQNLTAEELATFGLPAPLRVKAELVARGMNQKYLAQTLNISETQVSQTLNGKLGRVSLKTFCTIYQYVFKDLTDELNALTLALNGRDSTTDAS